jgi:dihydroorotate dehydrogenase (fumarate)
MVKQLVRTVSKIGYQKVAKPLMFRHKPDAVHKGLIQTAKGVQKLPLIRDLPKLWAHNDPMLETNALGAQFRNPVGLSAGFDTTIELPKIMRSVGFGWMTGGSVTWNEYKGNDGPWFHRLPKSKSLVVNKGLASEGTPVVAERLKHYDMKLFRDFRLNVSVAKTNSKTSVGDEAGIEDYCNSLAVFNKLEQVSMLEINISCPNTFGGEPFTTSLTYSSLGLFIIWMFL